MSTLEPRGPWGSAPGEIGPEPDHVKARPLTRETGQVTGARVPPQSVDLELCVLGAVMLEPREAYAIAADFLTRDSFYLDGHGIIFEVMGELHARGIPPDSPALLDELRNRQLLDKVGGSGVVMAMLNSVPTAANVEYHSRKVAETATLRRFIRGATHLVERAYKQDQPLDVLLADAENVIADIGQQGTRSPLVHGSTALQHEWEQLDALYLRIREAKAQGQPLPKLDEGYSTGLADLDALTGGHGKGMVTIVGAPPSVGKTAILLNNLNRLAVHDGIPCAFVSMEMSIGRLIRRLLCMNTWHGCTGIDTRMLRSPWHVSRFEDWQWGVLALAYEMVMKAPFWLIKPVNPTPSAIRAALREAKSKYGIEVAFGDYLGLMVDDESHGSNRVSEVTAISRKVKLMTEQLGFAMVMASQLGRGAMRERGGKSELHDLRDSGAIEQDADVVIMPHRPSYAAPDDAKHRIQLRDSDIQQYPKEMWAVAADQQMNRPAYHLHTVEMRVKKNRDGDIGNVVALMRPALGRFWDAVKDEKSAPAPPPTQTPTPGPTITPASSGRRTMNLNLLRGDDRD